MEGERANGEWGNSKMGTANAELRIANWEEDKTEFRLGRVAHSSVDSSCIATRRIAGREVGMRRTAVARSSSRTSLLAHSEKVRFGEGAETSTRGACAPQNRRTVAGREGTEWAFWHEL
jgi:hypothetical protein